MVDEKRIIKKLEKIQNILKDPNKPMGLGLFIIDEDGNIDLSYSILEADIPVNYEDAIDKLKDPESNTQFMIQSLLDELINSKEDDENEGNNGKETG
jgi:hypothetical protein